MQPKGAARRHITGATRSPIERAIAEEKTALDAVVRILRAAAQLFPDGATPGGCLVSTGSLTCSTESSVDR